MTDINFEELMRDHPPTGIWHWRGGTWHYVRRPHWHHFRATLPETKWAPLPHVGAGQHYFVFCAIDGNRLHNSIPHRYLIDDEGRITGDGYFGVFTSDEIARFSSLWNRHFRWESYDDPDPLTPDERREYDAMCELHWRTMLPPPAAMAMLLRVVGAVPGNGDVAWQALEASGITESNIGDVIDAGSALRLVQSPEFVSRVPMTSRNFIVGGAAMNGLEALIIAARDLDAPPHYEAGNPVSLDKTGQTLTTPIYWEGRQWAVTPFGVECRDGTYSIENERLWDGDDSYGGWVTHMASKQWADIRDFVEALRIARRRTRVAVDN